MVCAKSVWRGRDEPSQRWRGALLSISLFLMGGGTLVPDTCGQESPATWQADVRRAAEVQDWDEALSTVDREIALSPNDMDIRAWRARVLTWSGNLGGAEREYDEIIGVVPNDPDNWIGLATVYLREGRKKQALNAANRAVELDPKRADLRLVQGRILEAAGKTSDARLAFQQALELDSSSTEARDRFSSLGEVAKHELRVGLDNDLFSFMSANHDEWVSIVSKWTSNWTTSAAGSLYQWGGSGAGKFVGSVTRSQPKWGAVTVGGGTGHDNGVIPEAEAFVEIDHGFRISEERPIRGVEAIYGQHWYWYSSARILTINETAITYLPRDWSWLFRLTQARSRFSGTGLDWRPSGLTRLDFPLARWSARSLSGNVLFAVGTEDFAQVDQIGSFASHTYGGGLRFRMTARQDVTGYASFQQRTRDRGETSFGFSYGIRF